MRPKLLDAALLALLMAACQPHSSLDSAPPVDALAKMVPVAVGTHQFYLPIVAVTWAGRSNVLRPCAEEGVDSQWLCSVPIETLVAYSGIQGASVSATSVVVRLDSYSMFKNTKLDEWFNIPQLCGMLTQRWARQQCTGPELFNNLRTFTLIEEGSLAKLNGLSVIAGQKEPVGTAVQRMRFVGDEPNTDCAPNGQELCTAAMHIGNGVLAVWIVSLNSGAESVQRQAAAIRAFLKNAVGREENYEELRAALSRGTG